MPCHGMPSSSVTSQRQVASADRPVTIRMAKGGGGSLAAHGRSSRRRRVTAGERCGTRSHVAGAPPVIRLPELEGGSMGWGEIEQDSESARPDAHSLGTGSWTRADLDLLMAGDPHAWERALAAIERAAAVLRATRVLTT